MGAPGQATPSRVILTCGPAGSGKSTYARGLAAKGIRRLGFDEIAWELGFRVHPLSDADSGVVHTELQRRLAVLVTDGADVVVDTSFWSRKSRERYRRFLRPMGIEPEVHYVRTPREVILRRLTSRQGKAGDDAVVPRDLALQFLANFEVPTTAEGLLVVIDGARMG